MAIPAGCRIANPRCREWWHLNLVRNVANAVKQVALSAPIESTYPVPDISAILEGVDDLVPSKEYRSWIAAVDTVVNCPSYQYYLAFLLVLIARNPRKANNIKLYVVGWLYVITSWQRDFFERAGLGPNNNGQVPGAPPLVLNVNTRSAVPGAGSQWLETNAPLIARGDAYFFSGVSMTELEVRAASLMYLPYPQVYPQWLDGNGAAYALPSSMLRIGGSYEVGTSFPSAPAAIVMAGGWAQMAATPAASTVMSAMWKSEGPLVLVGFVKAAQMALGITLVTAANTRRWFTAVQEWRYLTLPRPDTSQFLRTAIASLDGKTQAAMVLNPFLGIAYEVCLSAFLMIGLAFHLAGSYSKYIMFATRNTLHLNTPGRVVANIRSAALGNEIRAPGTTTPWRLAIGSIFNKLFGVAPQLIVLSQPGIPATDAVDAAGGNSWADYSVNEVGFFPVGSLSMFVNLFYVGLLPSYDVTHQEKSDCSVAEELGHWIRGRSRRLASHLLFTSGHCNLRNLVWKFWTDLWRYDWKTRLGLPCWHPVNAAFRHTATSSTANVSNPHRPEGSHDYTTIACGNCRDQSPKSCWSYQPADYNMDVEPPYPSKLPLWSWSGSPAQSKCLASLDAESMAWCFSATRALWGLTGFSETSELHVGFWWFLPCHYSSTAQPDTCVSFDHYLWPNKDP